MLVRFALAAALIILLVLVDVPEAMAQKSEGRPTYPEMQRSWGLVAGHAFTVVLWQEECASRDAAWGDRLRKPFAEWKERNKYMDQLRANVYARARQEGGDAEAQRLSKEMLSLFDKQGKETRREIRTTQGWPCERLLQILNDRQLDPIRHYGKDVGVVKRAVD